MVLVILSWLKVGVNHALPCIFKPYIKLTIWVCLHSSVIIQKLIKNPHHILFFCVPHWTIVAYVAYKAEVPGM